MTYPDRSLVVVTIVGVLAGAVVSWVLQWPVHPTSPPISSDMTREQARGRLSALNATIVVTQEELRKIKDATLDIPLDQDDSATALLEDARVGEREARIYFIEEQFRKSFERATTAIVDAQKSFNLLFILESTTAP